MVFIAPNWPHILFCAISPRPGLYIGTQDAQGLVMYVQGYQECCRHQGLDEHQAFFDGFRDWLVRKYDFAGDHGWGTALRVAGIVDAKRCCANVMLYMQESGMGLMSHSEAVELWVEPGALMTETDNHMSSESNLPELPEPWKWARGPAKNTWLAVTTICWFYPDPPGPNGKEDVPLVSVGCDKDGHVHISVQGGTRFEQATFTMAPFDVIGAVHEANTIREVQ